MKFSTPVLFVGLLSVGLATASTATTLAKEQRLHNFIDDIINQTLSGIIGSIQDPFTIEERRVILTIPGLSTGYADISNLEITGIKSIIATEINSNILDSTFKATMNVPQLSLKTKYDTDNLFVELIPVYGSGTFRLDVGNVKVKVCANYILSPLSIYNVTLNFDVDELEFDIHGLFNNPALSALIESVLNDNVVHFVKDHHELIDAVLSTIANLILQSTNTTALPELDEKIAAFEGEFKAFKLNYDN